MLSLLLVVPKLVEVVQLKTLAIRLAQTLHYVRRLVLLSVPQFLGDLPVHELVQAGFYIFPLPICFVANLPDSDLVGLVGR